MGETKFFIAEWATKAGLRQKDLAKKAGLTKGYISQLWSGKYRKEPSVGVLIAIADACGIYFGALVHHPDTQEGAVIAALRPSKRPVAAERVSRLPRSGGKK